MNTYENIQSIVDKEMYDKVCEIFKNLKVASSRGNYIILNKILKEHNLKVK